MSGGVIEYACHVLGRAHALFGEPPAPPGTPTAGGGSALIDAADRTAAARHRAAALSGRLPDAYAGFGGDAAVRLGALAGADDQLASRLRAAAATDQAGHGASRRVLDAAAADAARLSPLAGSPAGYRALAMALRDRVSRQQRVVAAYRARDAQMAALLRTLTYRRGFSGAAADSARQSPVEMPSWPASAPGSPGVVEAAAVGVPTAASPHRLTMNSSPREVADALVQECRRRRYSPAQTCAILSTMLQESGANPRAVSPNGLWRGLFQQDDSYPGRDDPNTAITGFLDRLAARGGPSAPDVWKTIFWVQQAPGAASAEAALTSGRRAYLREIQSQLSRAIAMYRDLGAV